jgi:molybdate transport system regulatory protein
MMRVKDRARPRSRPWIARPRWRISRGSTIALGPGKADLLEAIDRAGSISAGARALGMSYRRAWLLVETMNACFGGPLIVTSRWRGTGARLTPAGRKVLRLYRGIERRSEAAAKPLLAALQGLLKPPSGRALPSPAKRD